MRLARAPAALLAGAVAIAVNIALLDGFDAAGIPTAHGGLQKLVKLWASPPLAALGADRLWTGLGLPGPETPPFMLGFKVGVALVMALIYALLIAPRWQHRPLWAGLVAALLFWIANAAIVLPLLGEGFAGMSTLSGLGILCFALAHTGFFLVLALLHDRLAAQPGNGWPVLSGRNRL
ncbi:MAG TPA: hypothetical protein VM689_13215 [Aliidongia sp.]|nr:hypothetical protein [Aliidongia sp.]